MLKNYIKNKDGVIQQSKIVNSKKKYDVHYVNESYNLYGDKVTNMSYLRLGFMIGAIKEKINSILDVGYGNGSFLKICTEHINECFGNDISEYPLPENCEFIDNIFENNFDVVCFFDSLEHFDDIEFVSKLKTKYIFISLPWCHYHSDEWFEHWKHRRVDEHLYHFNDKSLKNFMLRMGYECILMSNIEDSIRKPISKDYNILSGVFKKI